MNKLVVGTALGVAVGYAVAKMMDQEFMEKVSDNVHDFAAQAKKKAKDVWDKGENEVEYMKDRAEYAVDKGKQKLNQNMD